MDNEISEKAKAALANVQQRRARERLHRDGAESRPAMQRRVQALAAERSIPPADYAKLMYKRVSTGAVIAFCEKHNVSTDWLLCGDLKGLARMERERKEAMAAASHTGGASGDFLKVFCGLDKKTQAVVVAFIRKLADSSPPATPPTIA
jgi:hypothetical protein